MTTIGASPQIIVSATLGIEAVPKRYGWRNILWARAGRRFSCRKLTKPKTRRVPGWKPGTMFWMEPNTIICRPEDVRALDREWWPIQYIEPLEPVMTTQAEVDAFAESLLVGKVNP